jgi:hypothetical protein
MAKVADYLLANGWAVGKKGSKTKLAPTREGSEKAIEILNNEIFSTLPDPSSWSFGADEQLPDWLLVHGHRAFGLGKPFSEAGMIDFRHIANFYAKPISDQALHSVLSNLEGRDLVMSDRGPTKSKFWAYFNTGGIERAKLLSEIWMMRGHLPASNRFVRLDDNSPRFQDAIAKLEELINEAREIRVNDWPEKDGVIESLKSALNMIRAKYVNKAALIAAVSSATTFIVLKFAEVPIADLASRTWNAVKSLF